MQPDGRDSTYADAAEVDMGNVVQERFAEAQPLCTLRVAAGPGDEPVALSQFSGAGADGDLDCEGVAEESLRASPGSAVLEALQPFLAASVEGLEPEHVHEPDALLKHAVLLLPQAHVEQVQCAVTVAQQAGHSPPCWVGHSDAHPLEGSHAGRVTGQSCEHTHVQKHTDAAQEPGWAACQAATAMAGAQKQEQQIAQQGAGQPSLAQPDPGELLVLQSHAHLAVEQRGVGGSLVLVYQLPEQQQAQGRA